jgi:hypothetical protein
MVNVKKNYIKQEKNTSKYNHWSYHANIRSHPKQIFSNIAMYAGETEM